MPPIWQNCEFFKLHCRSVTVSWVSTYHWKAILNVVYKYWIRHHANPQCHHFVPSIKIISSLSMIWAINCLFTDLQPNTYRIISPLCCRYLSLSIIRTLTNEINLFFFQNSTFFTENITAYDYVYANPIFLTVNMSPFCPNQCISKRGRINYVRGCCDNASDITRKY